MSRALLIVVLCVGCSDASFLQLGELDDDAADVGDELAVDVDVELLDVHKSEDLAELPDLGPPPDNDTGAELDALEASSDTRDAIAVDTALEVSETAPASDADASDAGETCTPHWVWCVTAIECCSGSCLKGFCE